MRADQLLVAAFNNRNEAELAVDELKRAGFDKDQIGFALRGEDVYEGGMATDATGTKDARGAIKGATTGGLIGGLIGAVAFATVAPGVGAILAGSLLTGFMGGAAGGAAIGGIFGAMHGLGVSEEEAKYYQQEFESGRAIVMVRPGDRVPEALEILRRHGGYQATPRDHDLPTDGATAARI